VHSSDIPNLLYSICLTGGSHNSVTTTVLHCDHLQPLKVVTDCDFSLRSSNHVIQDGGHRLSNFC